MKMLAKKLFALCREFPVAGAVPAAKLRFAPQRVNHSQNPQIKEVIMSIIKKLVASFVGLNPAGPRSAAKIQAMLLAFILGTFALGVSPAAAQKYVTDPSTGKVVSAPVYGGTLTYPHNRASEIVDPFTVGPAAGWLIDGVNEKLAYGNWGLNREEYDFRDSHAPLFAFTGNLAKSWETPDPLTYVFHIRQGVHFALDPDSEASRLVGGRELTADDVVYTYQRNNALGDFTERPLRAGSTINLPWESIEARDKYTVVMKLTEPSINALDAIIREWQDWILPAEVIERYGDYKDWRNVVGTGPFILTDYVEGVSKSYIKNPDYWGFDEKYPQNRLPYIDQLRALRMAEEATRISAIRTGKVDMNHHAGVVDIGSIDVVRGLQKTNPEIRVWPFFQRNFQSFGLNMRIAPFDDIRVRHALQMALDLETINDTYYDGYAKVEPGYIAVKGYHTPFQEWPEELKQYYRYDPQGAEKLLDEAGYPRGADGVRFKVDYMHRDIFDLGFVEIAVDYWAEIGIEITIRVFDWGTIGPAKREGNYEMAIGDCSWYSPPAVLVGNYRADELWSQETVGGIETPELTAAYEAFFAATTIEQQMASAKEFDMAVMRQHNQVCGPFAPHYQVSHPWVGGFSGEWALGQFSHHTIFARLWIDQDLKKEMGF